MSAPVPLPPADDEVIHWCPLPGQAATPCCGRVPFELPRTDRMTDEPGRVTCHV